MLRLATAIVFVAVPLGVVAAPVPPPSEKELLAKHWGKTEGEGEFELKGKQLTIRSVVLPSRGFIGVIGNGRITVPRTTRTVRGDFEMTVKVLDLAMPNKEAKHTEGQPLTRAGLFIEGGGYAVEWHLFQYFSKINGVVAEQPNRCVWVDTWFPGGGAGSMLKNAEAGKSTHLRLSRKGKAVSVSYSFDGKEWSAPYTPRQALAFPDEVTVGVFFSHSTYQILHASFDGFTVEKLKPKKE
jgi:hypothetical protein